MGQADAEKLPVFLSASPAGRPMYEKRGFRVLGVEEVAEGYEQAYMIRDRTFNYWKGALYADRIKTMHSGSVSFGLLWTLRL